MSKGSPGKKLGYCKKNRVAKINFTLTAGEKRSFLLEMEQAIQYDINKTILYLNIYEIIILSNLNVKAPSATYLLSTLLKQKCQI